MKFLIIATLIGIVVSLGQAMFHMASGNGDSIKTARALTVRISLSVALFIFLLLGWYFGMLEPHHVR
jgi:type III secretory pathway component EscS